MRKRKWRVWIKSENEMIYTTGLDFDYSKRMVTISLDNHNSTTYCIDEVETMDYICETKGGQPVYEGDYGKAIEEEHWEYPYRFYEVKQGECIKYSPILGYRASNNGGSVSIPDLTIIGNKWENPNLKYKINDEYQENKKGEHSDCSSHLIPENRRIINNETA